MSESEDTFTSSITLTTLPPEVFQTIMLNLRMKDRLALRLVSKSLNERVLVLTKWWRKPIFLTQDRLRSLENPAHLNPDIMDLSTVHLVGLEDKDLSEEEEDSLENEPGVLPVPPAPNNENANNPEEEPEVLPGLPVPNNENENNPEEDIAPRAPGDEDELKRKLFAFFEYHGEGIKHLFVNDHPEAYAMIGVLWNKFELPNLRSLGLGVESDDNYGDFYEPRIGPVVDMEVPSKPKPWLKRLVMSQPQEYTTIANALLGVSPELETLDLRWNGNATALDLNLLTTTKLRELNVSWTRIRGFTLAFGPTRDLLERFKDTLEKVETSISETRCRSLPPTLLTLPKSMKKLVKLGFSRGFQFGADFTPENFPKLENIRFYSESDDSALAKALENVPAGIEFKGVKKLTLVSRSYMDVRPVVKALSLFSSVESLHLPAPIVWESSRKLPYIPTTLPALLQVLEAIAALRKLKKLQFWVYRPRGLAEEEAFMKQLRVWEIILKNRELQELELGIARDYGLDELGEVGFRFLEPFLQATKRLRQVGLSGFDMQVCLARSLVSRIIAERLPVKFIGDFFEGRMSPQTWLSKQEKREREQDKEQERLRVLRAELMARARREELQARRALRHPVAN